MSQFLELIDEQHIQIKLAVSSKKALFEAMARQICQLHPALADEKLVCALCQRERLGSTAIGHGIAIPHCRLADTERCVVGVFTLATPITYNDDNETVDLVALLIVPESATDHHIELLAQIAQLLNSDTIRQDLRQAEKPSDVIAALQFTPALLKSGTL